MDTEQSVALCERKKRHRNCIGLDKVLPKNLFGFRTIWNNEGEQLEAVGANTLGFLLSSARVCFYLYKLLFLTSRWIHVMG